MPAPSMAHFSDVEPLYHPATLGAIPLGDGRCRFRVWAPFAKSLELRLLDPQERLMAMQPRDRGYYELVADGVAPGTRYYYRLDGAADRPDPATRSQPEGVQGPSAVLDPRFDWHDDHWHGLSLHQYITYELHIGTFSAEGTFDGAIAHLDDLRALGVTAVEVMPIAQFPGGRNWGYDGVHHFAVQDSYGGPDGFRRFVDAAHGRGLAVVLDVVYNHFGPEGNYRGQFGPYLTERHKTPWGAAVNVDDAGSDEVRRYFIENALMYIDVYHVDALRLDAVHAIYDFSARPFLQELADAVRLEGERLNRRVYTIAESDLNDPRLLEPKAIGGYGIDAQWADDLHHAVRTTLTEERSGYYADYRGFEDLVNAYREGFVRPGQYSPHRGRRHGRPARHIDPIKLVVCAQNHDQVGNRLLGERLTELVGFEQLKLAAATVLLSPCHPMLFMGEEYGETAPFQFFISHTDPDLVEAVRRGRRAEFEAFGWAVEPPDPQAEATFARCKLDHSLKSEGRHHLLWRFYQRLIALRKSTPCLARPDRNRMDVSAVGDAQVMVVRRWTGTSEPATVFHYGAGPATVDVGLPGGPWSLVIDSADAAWGGPGSPLPPHLEPAGPVTLSLAPHSAAVYQRAL